jgi:glutathione S-transferase
MGDKSAPLPRLFYTTTSCGAASFIVAHTAQVNLSCEQVSLRDHKTQSGKDYYEINPKGNIPSLLFPDGTLLNETSAVIQWIADQVSTSFFFSSLFLTVLFFSFCFRPLQRPGSVAPENGTKERYLVQNALSYVASELHCTMGPLFYPGSEEVKEFMRNRLKNRMNHVESYYLSSKEYLVGNTFTVADAYLYIVLTWFPQIGLNIADYPKCKIYYERISNLPNVKAGITRMAQNPSSIL